MPILLVDDDSEDLELYEWIFRSLGHINFLKATNGHEAIQLLEQGFRPGLIVSDLNMPKIDGYELIKIIRDKYQPHIPIIILTTSAIADQHQRCRDLGATGSFCKPSSFQGLQQLMQTVYEQYYLPAIVQ